MTLYKEWKKLLESQTDETFDAFWEEYCNAEISIYKHVLNKASGHLGGTLGELSEKFNVKPVFFEGFLDGIMSSLKEKIDIEEYDENTEIDLDIDFEKLYYNMHKADAPHLFGLDEWSNVLTEEKRDEIFKEYKRSKTYIAPKKIGRNEPCPCGSGKKYKNCCGKTA